MKEVLVLLAVAVMASVLGGCGATNQSKPPQQIPGIIITASGLQYQELKIGTGYAPQTDEVVLVDYIAYLQADNKKVESSTDPGGKPFEFSIGHKQLMDGSGDAIAGVREAVRGMRIGGQRRLIIPPDLGYGPTGKPPSIPADAALIYYVEPKQVKQLHELQDSLAYVELQEGTGAAAKNGDKLKVNYTGWTYNDDNKFDSSLDPGDTPFEFTLAGDAPRVIDGWNLGLVGLKVGGKRRLIIPPALGYGDAGVPNLIPPNSWIIFNVELLEIMP